VFVRLYETATETTRFLQEVRLSVPDGDLATQAYAFDVADGTYTVRAFRDAGSIRRGTGAPDGEPTLGCDPQAPGLGVTVDGGDVPGKDLVLADTTDVATYTLDAYTDYVPAFAYEMTRRDADGKTVSTGSCTGFRLAVTARKLGDIDGNGKANTSDKTTMNLRIAAGVGGTTGYVERAFDLNGDTKVNTSDKTQLNLILAAGGIAP